MGSGGRGKRGGRKGDGGEDSTGNGEFERHDFVKGKGGRGKGSRGGREGLPTLPSVMDHMDRLLALPDGEREALGQCIPYPYKLDEPSPKLPPIVDPHKTIFGTVEMDSFGAAHAILSQGWARPAVLNMANEHNCGGAWCQKPGSQEEDLLRSSSLPLSLWPRRLPSDHRMPEFEPRMPRLDSIYPFAEAGAVYSPSVLVCRSQRGEAYARGDQCVVSVISSAAQDLRQEKRHYKGPFNHRLTVEKLRSQLWTAAHHGHTALVLGAFGCGAFRNEPDTIARLYWRLLGPGGEFQGRFRIVVFAIIKSSDNLRRFSEVFPWMRGVPRAETRTQKGGGRGAADQRAAEAGQPMPATVEVSTLTSTEREVLKLAKKLREVRKLEQRMAAGEPIAENQRPKLASKHEWLSSFGELLAFLPPDSTVLTKVQDVSDTGRDAS